MSKGKMKIGKIANSAKYQMDESNGNLLIFGILIILQIEKKIQIPKISNLENSQNFYFGKSAIIQFQFQIAMID